MNLAYLIIGGNVGDRLANLAAAKSAIIKEVGPITAQSSIYETAAWGPVKQDAYLNQVLAVQTNHEPAELLRRLLQIEQSLGRIRKERYGPRTVDLDILLYNDLIIETPDLQIPHPRMRQRRFVLEPLAEIAGDTIHPIAGKTIATMLQQCSDSLVVKKFSEAN